MTAMSVVPPPISTTILPCGSVSGILDGAPFNLSYLRRNTDNHARTNPCLAVVSLADEVLQHLLRDFEVGDHAIFHRSDSYDIAGCSSQHVFRIATYGFDLVGYFVDCDDRRLRDNDA